MFKQAAKNFLLSQGFMLHRLSADEKAKGICTDYALRHHLYRRALVLSVGEIGASERCLLGKLVAESDPARPIVEIGCLFGWSTLVIVSHKPSSQPCVVVDNFSWNPLGLSSQEHFDITQARLSDAIENHHLQLIRKDKNLFFEEYSGDSPGLVFLDADHSYEETKRDIEWAKSVGSQIICGHDYEEKTCPGVVQAVDEFGGPHELVQTLWSLKP